MITATAFTVTDEDIARTSALVAAANQDARHANAAVAAATNWRTNAAPGSPLAAAADLYHVAAANYATTAGVTLDAAQHYWGIATTAAAAYNRVTAHARRALATPIAAFAAEFERADADARDCTAHFVNAARAYTDAANALRTARDATQDAVAHLRAEKELRNALDDHDAATRRLVDARLAVDATRARMALL